jgi:hypothetical protein
VAAAHLLLRKSMWDQLLLRNPHNKLLRLYMEKKRASSYRGILDRIDTELYLTGALIFDWCGSGGPASQRADARRLMLASG